MSDFPLLLPLTSASKFFFGAAGAGGGAGGSGGVVRSVYGANRFRRGGCRGSADLLRFADRGALCASNGWRCCADHGTRRRRGRPMRVFVLWQARVAGSSSFEMYHSHPFRSCARGSRASILAVARDRFPCHSPHTHA